MAKKKKIKPVKVKKQKNKAWIFAAIVIIILVAIFTLSFVKPTANIGGTNQGGEQGQEQSQTTPTGLAGDICRRDSECFLANCRSTPNDIDCVNSTHQELYYKECKSLNDVRIAPQDFTRCGCIQGRCKIK